MQIVLVMLLPCEFASRIRNQLFILMMQRKKNRSVGIRRNIQRELLHETLWELQHITFGKGSGWSFYISSVYSV
jgi:hypothetical protein